MQLPFGPRIQPLADDGRQADPRERERFGDRPCLLCETLDRLPRIYTRLAPPPDPAYGDSYLGNGYYPTWCADVARQLLQKASTDSRFGFGESILTVWPWPNPDFGGGNGCVRAIRVKGEDRTVTVAMPILHFLGLLARMGPKFHVLAERNVGDHVVSGFASRDGDKLRVMLYSHSALDTQSRSDAAFDATLRLTGLTARKVVVHEYRYDKDHNSYFRLGRELRDHRAGGSPTAAQSDALHAALRDLDSDRTAVQLAGLDKLLDLGPAAASAIGGVYELHGRSDDFRVKDKAAEVLKLIRAPKVYPAAVVKKGRRIVYPSANRGFGCDGWSSRRFHDSGPHWGERRQLSGYRTRKREVNRLQSE